MIYMLKANLAIKSLKQTPIGGVENWDHLIGGDYDEEYGRNIFTFSLWDRDIIKSNEMICEARLDLNDYNTLVKAYKRQETVKLLRLNPKTKK